MSIELKIKSKHLSLEADVIRFEERKLQRQIKWLKDRQQTGAIEVLRWKRDELKHHRKWNVRNENRATFLARAFIDQVPYKITEKSRKPENEITFWSTVFPRVVKMIIKYDKNFEYPADLSKATKVVDGWIRKE